MNLSARSVLGLVSVLLASSCDEPGRGLPRLDSGVRTDTGGIVSEAAVDVSRPPDTSVTPDVVVPRDVSITDVVTADVSTADVPVVPTDGFANCDMGNVSVNWRTTITGSANLSTLSVGTTRVGTVMRTPTGITFLVLLAPTAETGCPGQFALHVTNPTEGVGGSISGGDATIDVSDPRDEACDAGPGRQWAANAGEVVVTRLSDTEISVTFTDVPFVPAPSTNANGAFTATGTFTTSCISRS